MIKAVFGRFSAALRKFRDDVRGAVLPYVGLLGIVMVVVAGAGIDYGRAINEREIMAHALDAAALAVASQLSTSIMSDAEIGDMLEQTFEANLSALGYKNVALDNMTFTVDPDEGVVRVSSSINVPTYFVGLAGIGPETIPVRVNTEVNYSKFDVELTLVLDVTGSMGGDMGALKDASQELLNTLIPAGTAESDSKVRISIVPYSQGVNLGLNAATVTNGTATGGCVTERLAPGNFTDDAYDYKVDEEDDDPAVTYYFGGGSSRCPLSQLQPLTANRRTLETSITGLVANGGTAGQTGIAWGWYTLSPEWANFWPAASAPEAYTNTDVLKFAVVMTDGDFNQQYDYVRDGEDCSGGEWQTQLVWRWTWRGWRQVEERVWVQNCVPRYRWNETYLSRATYNDPPATRAREICDAMADEGIEIYSIYFDTGGAGFGDDLMEACASSPRNYYTADSREDLINAFGNIAKKIQSIYLAK
ncbi:pilus assembly protein TadG-related protein [Roseibium sp.]|uniref:pilus assembly protein TadG-related protein n=1 Tax=Roseibium sp. TaxID=1936156 RepID=UPI003A976932